MPTRILANIARAAILKEVAAGEGAMVCEQDGVVSIDGKARGRVAATDRHGRAVTALVRVPAPPDGTSISCSPIASPTASTAAITGRFRGRVDWRLSTALDGVSGHEPDDARRSLCFVRHGGGQAPPAGTDCPAVARAYQDAAHGRDTVGIGAAARDAIARVAYAEAGNQGDTGLAGVVYTVLNRLMDGGFGGDVTRCWMRRTSSSRWPKSGGWQRLPPRSAVEQAHIDTILNLALDGRLPDPTNGARFFQNPAIVAGPRRSGNRFARPGKLWRTDACRGDQGSRLLRDRQRSGASAAAAPSLFVPVQTASDGAGRRPAEPSSSQPSSLFVPLSR